jgi:hypothetical protein
MTLRPLPHGVSTCLAFALIWLLTTTAWAGAGRIVIIKADGLPGYLLEDVVNQKNDETGQWELPWIRKVFFEGGVEVANFYTRGISVSAPSWSAIETGHDPIIRGNVEFDRYSLHVYDYLNFFPFYFRNALSRQVDMPGVEVLDSVGTPMVSDAFPPEQRYQGFQLFQRGVRWNSITASLKRGVNPHSVRNLVDEWLTGFQMEDAVGQQTEQELIEKLQDPNVRYLDLFDGDFDHVAHLTHDRRVLQRELRNLDRLVGRIRTAIEASSLAQETALVIVSDHGINNDPAVFGQGWNLVEALNSAEGGGHHVITNRHPRSDFTIRGLNPFVSEVTNDSSASFYLKGEASNYPTALVDLDGNERANVYLRNSDWNALQILQQQQRRRDLSPALRGAIHHAMRDVANRNRKCWLGIGGAGLSDLERVQPPAASQDKSDAARRQAALAKHVEEQLRAYRDYLRGVAAVLDPPDKAGNGPAIPRRAMGELNSIFQLQHYVVGLAPGGPVLDAAGGLDWERSFVRVNYFEFFSQAHVRNLPQAGLSDHPVDFLAARVPGDELARALPPDLAADEGIFLYKSDQSQALLLRRGHSLRYLPVKDFEETAAGELRFSIAPWSAGLPLAGFEGVDREWLEQWHSERDWLCATYRTPYSNAAVGLFAELSAPMAPAGGDALRLFQWRERLATRADLLILANNHWNFNVRNFNPGGNHGSFFPVSTHATLLFAGGSKTGIPQGLKITEPYDGLSYAPTVLKLAGKAEFSELPGPVIEELFPVVEAKR